MTDGVEVESYHPTPVQRAFHQAPQMYKAFIGGFGSGKTLAGIQECIDAGMRYPRDRIAVMRDTMPELRDTTMHDFFESCPSELISEYRRKEATVLLKGGSELLFRSFRQYKSSPRNQFESKIKGLNLGGFMIDEANEVAESEFRLVQGRLRLAAVPRHFGLIVSNPPNKDHWIPQIFEAPGTDKAAYFIVHVSSRENPYLPADYIPNLLKAYPPSWVKKFVDGEYGFMATGEPVYEGFKEGFHTRRLRPQPQYGMHRYWDFGWHRPAVLWAQVRDGGLWRVFREYMGHQMHVRKFVARLLEIQNEHFPGFGFSDFCDPAGLQKRDTDEQSAIQILQSEYNIRFTYRPAPIKEGIDIVQGKICQLVNGEPAFCVDPEGCPILVAGFLGGYAREKALDGRGMMTSDPVQDGYYEHVHDGLRYGAVNVFSSRSENKRQADFFMEGPSYDFGGPRQQEAALPSAPSLAQPGTIHIGGQGWTLKH